MFLYNVATSLGGGALLIDCVLMSFTGTSIFDNNVADGGGGIYSLASSLHFDGQHNITNNSALGYFDEVYGGGLYMEHSTFSSSHESLLVFHGNVAGKDGYDSSRRKEFIAPGNGGAVFATNSTILLEGNAVVSVNIATVGGGIALQYCTATFGVIGCTLVTNTCIYECYVGTVLNIFMQIISHWLS